MLVLRSVAFNILFYLNLVLHIILALPTFALPRGAFMALARSWGRTSNVLLRAAAGISVEYRGLEKIPRGALLVAREARCCEQSINSGLPVIRSERRKHLVTNLAGRPRLDSALGAFHACNSQRIGRLDMRETCVKNLRRHVPVCRRRADRRVEGLGNRHQRRCSSSLQAMSHIAQRCSVAAHYLHGSRIGVDSVAADNLKTRAVTSKECLQIIAARSIPGQGSARCNNPQLI